MVSQRSGTRIQQKNRIAILDAALDVFSAQGFRGSTVDQIASAAGLSKPNLLYYYPSKEAMHIALLSALLETWLAPLEQIDPDGEPVAEIVSYVIRKLEMARDYPRESRLFANEIIQGAPRIHDALSGPLKALVDEKAEIIRAWSRDGRLAECDPYHLIFSIWSTTQHYADFDVQVRAILGPDSDPFDAASAHLTRLFTSYLTPGKTDRQ